LQAGITLLHAEARPRFKEDQSLEATMTTEPKKPVQNPPKRKVALRYDQTAAQYASQFLINVGSEELILNFSSGYVTDPGTGAHTLPVHTRIALTPSGAARLAGMLQEVLKQAVAGAVKASNQAGSSKMPPSATKESSSKDTKK
jgi:hypothetical protein